MAKSGRKRKANQNRNASGRIRYEALFDKGTDYAQAMQALYGQDGADAIGRAFRSGLLGEGSEAKAVLDIARAISGAYWAAYATGSYVCPLADRTHGNVTSINHERIKRREEWLNDCLSDVRRMGQDVNRAFRQLVIDVNPDCGPAPLDRLIYAARQHKAADIADQRWLRAALDALEMLAT